jgi:hypothetical protein
MFIVGIEPEGGFQVTPDNSAKTGPEPLNQRIIGLIHQSRLVEADAIILDAIRQLASEVLQAASLIDDNALHIVGWDRVCAEFLEADRELQIKVGRPCSIVSLEVFNRADWPNDRHLIDERLSIGRGFYAVNTIVNGNVQLDRSSGFVQHAPDYPRSKVWIEGLENITGIQRNSSGDGYKVQQLAIDYTLSSLLLTTKYHRLIDRTLRAQWLPRSVAVLVQQGVTVWPQEQGVVDHGYFTRRFIDRHSTTPALPTVFGKHGIP